MTQLTKGAFDVQIMSYYNSVAEYKGQISFSSDLQMMSI